MFVVGTLKGAFWALPAGFGIGIIISSWFDSRKKRKGELMGVLDSRTASPEMRKAMDGLVQALKEEGKLPEGMSFEDKKCDDPHCKACHPESAY